MGNSSRENRKSTILSTTLSGKASKANLYITTSPPGEAKVLCEHLWTLCSNRAPRACRRAQKSARSGSAPRRRRSRGPAVAARRAAGGTCRWAAGGGLMGRAGYSGARTFRSSTTDQADEIGAAATAPRRRVRMQQLVGGGHCPRPESCGADD